MSVTQVKKLYEVNEIHLDRISELTAKLGPRFAERAARADEGDLFVAENFGELKAHGLVAAGVPEEFGGRGAGHAELSDMLRELGHYCGSTALAFSMHTHQVATAAWRWQIRKPPSRMS
jgi:indole-3-acetate monooxygenase